MFKKHATISQAECRSFEASNVHIVGLNQPSWHTNPFYFTLATNPTTTEIEQSPINSYDDFSCISRDVFKLEENILVSNSVASNFVLR